MSAAVASTNGSGGVSRIVTDVIVSRDVGRPSASASAAEICCTISIPSTTRPKIVYCPSSAGWSVAQTKNCAPPLFGLLGVNTADTAPIVCFSEFSSPRSWFNPPVPYCAVFAGSFDSGSPPWMIP